MAIDCNQNSGIAFRTVKAQSDVSAFDVLGLAARTGRPNVALRSDSENKRIAYEFIITLSPNFIWF